jgi:transcriptional regulator with GAF, ATPase, and Fis domain
LRARLDARGIESIIRAQKKHPHATHQDGHKLRRYRRRWIVERTFAWLGWCRRLLVRHERFLSVYAALLEELGEAEKRRVVEVLRQVGGSRTEAAKMLGVPRTTLLNKMRRYGLS